MSTRDIEDAFRDVTGELLISRSAVSEITGRLWAGYQEFTARDLSEVEAGYLFADSIFESLRAQGAKEELLVAWCIAADGRKHLLHLAVGNKESEACWTEFFRHMLGRGMRLPATITSDGAPGLINAIAACFPSSVRIRCWFHKLAKHRPVPGRSRARARPAPDGRNSSIPLADSGCTRAWSLEHHQNPAGAGTRRPFGIQIDGHHGDLAGDRISRCRPPLPSVMNTSPPGGVRVIQAEPEDLAALQPAPAPVRQCDNAFAPFACPLPG
jgi:Transposase, Mutator family